MILILAFFIIIAIDDLIAKQFFYRAFVFVDLDYFLLLTAFRIFKILSNTPGFNEFEENICKKITYIRRISIFRSSL